MAAGQPKSSGPSMPTRVTAWLVSTAGGGIRCPGSATGAESPPARRGRSTAAARVSCGCRSGQTFVPLVPAGRSLAIAVEVLPRLGSDPRSTAGMLDAGGQRVQTEPLWERAHQMPWTFELDGVTLQCRGHAEVSHPYGCERRRIAGHSDVDPESWVAQA